MLRRFVCPDGEEIEIKRCLAGPCRCPDTHGLRCAPIAYLEKAAEQREWKGVPSTTQLIKGTRQAYLEIVTEYAEDPRGRAYALLGTSIHKVLEAHQDNALVEERLKAAGVTGIADRLEPHPDGGYILTDWKTTGSYKVHRARGEAQEDVPTGETYKTGARKGQPKTRKEWVPGHARDRLDWAIQINWYRLMIERAGFPVRTMRIVCILRDSGTRWGMDSAVQTIYVNRISDNWLYRYMSTKTARLLAALESAKIPPMCNARETWHGRRCDGYCPVAETCQKHQKGGAE